MGHFFIRLTNAQYDLISLVYWRVAGVASFQFNRRWNQFYSRCVLLLKLLTEQMLKSIRNYKCVENPWNINCNMWKHVFASVCYSLAWPGLPYNIITPCDVSKMCERNQTWDATNSHVCIWVCVCVCVCNHTLLDYSTWFTFDSFA